MDEYVTRTELKDLNDDLKALRGEVNELKVLVVQNGANAYKYIAVSALSLIGGFALDIVLKTLHLGV